MPVSNSATTPRCPNFERSGGRVIAVHTDDGERIGADAVVLTTELPDTYRLLGRTPRRLLPLRPAPSAVVAHVGCRAAGRDAGASQHPVRRRLGADLQRHHRRRAGDVGSVAAGDPAHRGRSSLAPRAATCSTSGAGAQSRCRHKLIGTPSGPPTCRHDRHRHAPLPELGRRTECCTSSTPPTGPARAWWRAPRSRLAHTFAQTGPFRPANTVRGIDNVVLAGSSTVPGVGVPTALLSGRLAADRITGARRAPRPTRGGAP